MDLPELPDHLRQILVDQVHACAVDYQQLEWCRSFFGIDHVADIQYANKNLQIDPDICADIRGIYAKFFHSEIVPVLGFHRCVDHHAVTMGPHCDRQRKLAINYLIELGGNDVKTRFYHECRDTPDMDRGLCRPERELTPLYDVCLPDKTWHVYDVQRFHSVHNITGTRALLSLVLVDNPDYAEFVSRYADITNDVLCSR